MSTKDIQFQSQTWIAFTKYLQTERHYYIELLATDQTDTETVKLRGRIAQIDDILNLQRDPNFR